MPYTLLAAGAGMNETIFIAIELSLALIYGAVKLTTTASANKVDY